MHHFPPFWSDDAIAAGVSTGQLVTGRLRQRRPGKGVVLGGGPGQLASVLVTGREALNRALDGDTVAVRVLPRSEWLPPVEPRGGAAAVAPSPPPEATTPTADAAARDAAAERFADDAALSDAETGFAPEADDASAASWRGGDRVGVGASLRPPAASEGGSGGIDGHADEDAAAAAANAEAANAEAANAEAAEAKAAAAKALRPTGEVVGILARSRSPVVAVVEPGNEGGDKAGQHGRSNSAAAEFVVTPRHAHMPKLRVAQPADMAPLASGTLYSVQVGGWGAAQRFPSGAVTSEIGPVGEPAAESRAILLDHGFAKGGFSEEATAALPTAGWQAS